MPMAKGTLMMLGVMNDFIDTSKSRPKNPVDQSAGAVTVIGVPLDPVSMIGSPIGGRCSDGSQRPSLALHHPGPSDSGSAHDAP